jgi:rhamnulose-1-phosphate aldolase/alcohol dehydrogenase
MQSRWSDAAAGEFVARYSEAGEDVALRVYSSRLIGSDPCLVMHGGGNTSVKSERVDLLGERQEAIFVKGSGWNLDSIEPAGLPGLDLAYLRRLRTVSEMSDEEMVNQLRTHLFDAASPNPSVETLLHAFLPHKFVDHSHADVIVALSNQDTGEALLAEALGPGVAFVPYVMPGFDLAQAAAAVAEQNPEADALVLLHHGLFTWGDTARQSYERHLELVSRAEVFLEAKVGRRLEPSRGAADSERRRELATRLAPHLRGLLTDADEANRSWILDFRCNQAAADLLDDPEAAELVCAGPLTPDHVIRTKASPLLLDAPGDEPLEAWRQRARLELGRYMEAYAEYFRTQVENKGRHELRRLDPLPRLIAVQGVGTFAVGESRKAAGVAGDIFDHTAEVKSAARSLGGYRALDEADLFDVEYWSLEQAKLGRGGRKPLAGRVALVTGAGGAIGGAIVEALAADGAAVVATDVAEPALEATLERVRAAGGEHCVSVVGDVTDERSMAGVFDRACLELGGLDIVVLNAGVASSSPIADLELEEWQRVVDINLTGYFVTLREAARLFRRQGSGGNVVVNASKNVFAPGAEFAAYSVSKSGGHQLGRLAAIELAPLGVRVNMVNPDAIFSHGEVPSGLWQDVGPERARARGLEPKELESYYRERNLLKATISAADVARAVLFFARGETPTTGATLPVDGGLPAAFPR